eukprot:s2487_g1.t1
MPTSEVRIGPFPPGSSLLRATYLHLAARVAVGFQKRLADCRAAERYLQEESLRADVSAQQHALEPAVLPLQVEEFIRLHDGQAKFRRPILAIVGRRIHSGVILDGVGDALFLKRHRETLQGRPEMHTLGARRFDMQSTIQIAGFEMKAASAAGSPKLFAVSFGDDSTAGPWQPVDTFRIHAEWNGVKRWPFPGSYAGRFWKISVQETFDGSAPTINYMRFYPPEGALNERPPASSKAPMYNTVKVKMGEKAPEAGLQNLIIMDIVAFDASGNQFRIMELHIFADKNGADAIAPGTYTGGTAMEALTDGSHTTLGDGGWVNGERGRDPHIGVHGITSAGSELLEIVADGDIVRLQVDFCRKNDAPTLRFVRGDGAESISPGQSGMEGVSEQVHFPAPPTTLAGHRLFNSEEGQWKAGDEIRPPTLPTGWSYEFPSFATGLCTAKVLRVQRKVPSKAACEMQLG